jgi:hypothetical protein
MKKPKTPQTPREIALYRAKLHCKIGQEVLKGEMIPPDGVGRVEYSLCCLLHAVEDVAAALSHDCKPINEKTVLQFRK